MHSVSFIYSVEGASDSNYGDEKILTNGKKTNDRRTYCLLMLSRRYCTNWQNYKSRNKSHTFFFIKNINIP